MNQLQEFLVRQTLQKPLQNNNMKICKKCDVQMDIKNPQVKRRGNEQKNIHTEYYCTKCDHSEYDD